MNRTYSTVLVSFTLCPARPVSLILKLSMPALLCDMVLTLCEVSIDWHAAVVCVCLRVQCTGWLPRESRSCRGCDPTPSSAGQGLHLTLSSLSLLLCPWCSCYIWLLVCHCCWCCWLLVCIIIIVVITPGSQDLLTEMSRTRADIPTFPLLVEFSRFLGVFLPSRSDSWNPVFHRVIENGRFLVTKWTLSSSKCAKRWFTQGFTPHPAGRAYNAPQTPFSRAGINSSHPPPLSTSRALDWSLFIILKSLTVCNESSC